ncbi:MAG: hypothetical protein OEY52_14165 [Gammaproteobacteria bacterium]|nr:hypothetical protein [Gammaproteobacteria bacterium]
MRGLRPRGFLELEMPKTKSETHLGFDIIIGLRSVEEVKKQAYATMDCNHFIQQMDHLIECIYSP